MIELLAGTVGILAVLFIGAVVYAHTYRDERNDARLSLAIAQADVSALTKRVNELTNRNSVLRSDTQAQQKTIDDLRAGHDRLVDERDQALRELGRLKAQAIADKQAAQPKRDPKTGRFLPRPKTAKPASPIACG